MKKIKAGETAQVPFLVGVAADATPGFYPLALVVDYSVDNAIQPEIQQNLGLKVEANPQLLITSDFGAASTTSSSSTGGSLLTMTVANVGDTAVRGVYMKASSSYFRIIGASDKFIGTLNLDDSSTMSLTLVPQARVGNATSQGEPAVTVFVSYKDPLNQEHIVEQSIPVQLDAASALQGQASSNGSQRFLRQQQDQGFLGVSWMMWGGAVAVLALAAGYWWFRMRKKPGEGARERK